MPNTIRMGLQVPVSVDAQGNVVGIAIDQSTAGSSGTDRELIVTTFTVVTAFTGASIGDIVTATQILDVSGTPSTVSTVWRNQSTALDLASAPSSANITIVGSTALTLAQAQSLGLATNTNVTALNTATGTISDASWSGTGNASVISILKSLWTKLGTTLSISAASLPLPTGASTEATITAMSAKLPASLGQKAMSASTSITVASDQSPLPTDVRASASAQAVTPSDSTNLTGTARALYVGTGGNVVAIIGGTSITFTNVQDGFILPIACTRINATSTTATNMVALY